MSEPKLFVALPTLHGTMPARFLTSAMNFVIKRPYEADIHQAINCYPNLGRNTIAHYFLKSEATHLLFIDADIIFQIEDVERLIKRDVDIVGGFYAKKKEGQIEWVCCSLPSRPPPVDGLVELGRIGTGFLMIKRGVLETMVKAYGKKIEYYDVNGEMYHDLFPMGIVNHEYLTEDWYFCENARALGYKVYGDTTVKLGHIGTSIFPLEMQIDDNNRRYAEQVKKVA